MSKPITEEEITALSNTRNVSEWNGVCDSIKKARGGAYPSDWWPKVMGSGLNVKIQAKWADPESGKLRAEPMTEEEINNVFGRVYSRLR